MKLSGLAAKSARKTLIPSLVGLFLIGQSPAQENLIKNPGFDQAPPQKVKLAGGWWLYEAKGDPKLTLDRTVSNHGDGSARLQASDDTKASLVSAPFTVTAGDEIRFSAWVRGESPAARQSQSYVGLAFRAADGRVFGRSYVQTPPLTTTWVLVAGTTTAPADAVSAELHLGYTNAPAALWFDDACAIITSPVSLSLAALPKPWPGQQELALLLVSRLTNRFQGRLTASIGVQHQTRSVTLEPKGKLELKLPVNLTRVGAHNYRLSLADSTGATLRTLEGKFHTRPPLVLYPACPCYHVIGDATGDTRLDAVINLGPEQRSGLSMAIEVTGPDHKQIQTASADASKGEIVTATFRVPVNARAALQVTARLLDRSGKELARAATDLHVIPRDEALVETGLDGFLRIAGKARFPVGLYSSGRYDQMGQARFTATHSYQITTGEPNEPINPRDSELKDLLDKSWSNGLRMMVELPRKAIEKAQWQQVRRRIETFRHHPGLLCWGSEERVARGTCPLSHLETLYRLVHELDPDHPLVLGDTKDVIQKFKDDRRDFFPDPCMDAGIWWWYPIPLHGPDGNGLDDRDKAAGLLKPPPWLTTTVSKKPLWIAIQSYQHPRKDARFPTPAEYRCMAYLSIINGVKGLWFYTGSGQRDWQGKPAGLLNKPEEGRWDYVQKLATELHDFSPVIVAPIASERLTLAPADAPIEFTTRLSGSHLYLIAANKSDRAQSVQFTSSCFRGRRPQLLYEPDSAQPTLESDSLSSVFAPFAVHLYRLD